MVGHVWLLCPGRRQTPQRRRRLFGPAAGARAGVCAPAQLPSSATASAAAGMGTGSASPAADDAGGSTGFGRGFTTGTDNSASRWSCSRAMSCWRSTIVCNRRSSCPLASCSRWCRAVMAASAASDAEDTAAAPELDRGVCNGTERHQNCSVNNNRRMSHRNSAARRHKSHGDTGTPSAKHTASNRRCT